jgi:Rod binding domain-containing protein
VKPVPVVDTVAGARAPQRDPRVELKKLSKELEGVFLRQLIESMRATVPKESGLEGAGEETFQGLLDDALSSLAASKMERGIGEALYRQLTRRLTPPVDGEPGSTP